MALEPTRLRPGPRIPEQRRSVDPAADDDPAITRGLALTPILAAVAAVLLSLGLAPVEPSIVPPDCPPIC